jgi:hypothetical protein
MDYSIMNYITAYTKTAYLFADSMYQVLRAKKYYLNGKLHRVDGPAIEYPCGFKEYYLYGKYKTYQEFEKLVKLKAFW